MASLMVLLLASGLSVVCGWQPMPDGSASYECVVQLEPEQVSTLQAGDSIPLTVDVPEHVRPIRRIRILVGNGPVPQNTLAADIQRIPSDDAKLSRQGIVETQYVVPGNTADNRYSSQGVNQQVSPAQGFAANTQDAFASSLQQGRQAVGEVVTQATQEILPPNAGRAVSDTIDRAGQQFGNQLRGAASSAQQDLREMFGASPTASNNTLGRDVAAPQILPPGSNPAPNNFDNRGSIPVTQGTNPSSRKRVDQPIDSRQPTDWRSGEGSPQGSNTANNSVADPRTTTINPRFSSNQPQTSSQPANQFGGTPLTGANNSQAPRYRPNTNQVIPESNRYPNGASGQQPSQFNNPLSLADGRTAADQPSGNGPSFPAFTPSSGGVDSQTVTPTPTTIGQASNATPQISRRMLEQPLETNMQDLATSPGTQPTSVNFPAANNQGTSQPGNFGSNTIPQSQPPVFQTATNAAGGMFPLFLSWVLLSGSGAGNLYLFWSYLDVRNKYRDLVAEFSHKIGRRPRD